MSSILTLVLLAVVAVACSPFGWVRSGPLPLHFATRRVGFRTATNCVLGAPSPSGRAGVLHMARSNLPDERPPARPFRNPFASSDPLAKHRAITGINARVRWYQRVGSLAGIIVLVAITGTLVALSVGLMFVAARVILDILIG